MNRPLIYVAGPFRAKTAYGVRQNIRRAEAAALEVWKLGAVAICPQLNTANFTGELPDEVFLEGDLEILARCDAILTVPGWRESKGSVSEVKFAAKLGIPVLESLLDLAEWWPVKDFPQVSPPKLR